MAQTPEGKVKAAIKAFLSSLPNCWSFMPVSNGMGVHGIPDIICCYKGVFVGIECKAPGKVGSTTPLQKMQLRMINMALGYAIAVDNVETVKGLIRDVDAMLGVRGGKTAATRRGE